MTYYTAIKYNKNRKLHLPDFVVDILGPENFQSSDLTEAFHWLLALANGTGAFHWLLGQWDSSISFVVRSSQWDGSI